MQRIAYKLSLIKLTALRRQAVMDLVCYRVVDHAIMSKIGQLVP